MANKNKLFIGVDLGGTKILVATFDDSMSVLASDKIKTPKEGREDEVVLAVASSIKRVLAQAGHTVDNLSAIGIAVPAPIDRKKGLVLYTPNMGLKNYPLAAKLGEHFSAPISLDNDVQAGVYGELRAGALRGKKNALAVFIGTGVGGGIVIDGRLYRGSSGSAGEVGHTILLKGANLCGCGNYGCLEAMVSRTCIAKDAAALATSGKAPNLLRLAGTDVRKYRSSVLYKAMIEGDKGIRDIIDRAATWLGVGLANFIHVLNPEAIVIGGGLAIRFGQRYLDVVIKSMEENLMPGLSGTVKVCLSELGDLAVPFGAAYFARELLQ